MLLLPLLRHPMLASGSGSASAEQHRERADEETDAGGDVVQYQNERVGDVTQPETDGLPKRLCSRGKRTVQVKNEL